MLGHSQSNYPNPRHGCPYKNLKIQNIPIMVSTNPNEKTSIANRKRPCNQCTSSASPSVMP